MKLTTFPPTIIIAVMKLVIILSNQLVTDAKRVVFFPLPHASYVRSHTNVARQLKEFGHETYVLVPKYLQNNDIIPVNTKDIKAISYGEYMGNFDEEIGGPMLENIWKGDHHIGMSMVVSLTRKAQDCIRKILTDKVLLKTLQKIKPDLFVITNHPTFKNLVILPYMLDLPFAYLSNFNDLFGQRVPFSPSVTACTLNARFSNEGLTFLDRIRNTVCYVTLAFVLYLNDDKLMAEVAPHRPQISVDDLSRLAELYIVESDHILDYAKPELPNVKLVGSTASSPAKSLSEPFKTFMDNSQTGVVLVSFGSAILNLPRHIALKMASAFEQQNLDVVWRVNFTSPNPDKILTALWVPQNDILGHRNTRVLISHCGSSSQYEALFHGVPILCLPLVNDQDYNARRSTSKGFGLSADIIELSTEELVSLIKEVANNETYRINIRKASSLYKQLFENPAKEAAFWIDHVMVYGGTYMRSAGQEIPLYQFLVLDVIAFFGVIAVLIAWVCYKICCFCCCCCCCCCGSCWKRLYRGTRDVKEKRE